MVQDIVGNIEVHGDLLEVFIGQLDGASQHVVFGIEQVIPLAPRQRLDAAGEHITHGRIADLRAEAHIDLVLDLGRIANKGVVADERPEAVRKDRIVGFRLHRLENPVARVRA